MPGLKGQEIPFVAIAEENILPIVSLKEEPPKQNKPKDGVGDLSAIVIIKSDDDNTILLLVPIASY
jgi:hypothetical protein